MPIIKPDFFIRELFIILFLWWSKFILTYFYCYNYSIEITKCCDILNKIFATTKYSSLIYGMISFQHGSLGYINSCQNMLDLGVCSLSLELKSQHMGGNYI